MFAPHPPAPLLSRDVDLLSGPSAPPPASFSLRPATAADRESLYALDRAAMRKSAEAAGGWDEAARRASFDRHFDPARISVIVVDGRDVGVLRLEERGDTLYVAVIEVAPDAQGRGIGTAVMRRVLARADAEARPVGLRVLEANARARALYERLGFRETWRADGKVEMRYDPRPTD